MSSRRPPTIDPIPAIRSHLVEATGELFEAYGVPVAFAADAGLPDSTDEELLTSSIGYTSDHVRGSLLVLTNANTARSWGTTDANESNIETLSDTVGEFTNMLLGRLKNRLLSHGVVLSIATPTSTIGRNLRVLSSAANSSLWLRFDGDGSTAVYVRLDLTFEPGFAMTAAPSVAPAPAASEGDMMLF